MSARIAAFITIFLFINSTPALAIKNLALILEQPKLAANAEWEDELRQLVFETVQSGGVHTVSTNERSSLKNAKTCIEFRSVNDHQKAKLQIKRYLLASHSRNPISMPKLSLQEKKACVSSSVKIIRPNSDGQSLTSTGAPR